MTTVQQQRIAHLEKLADDAGKTLAFLQSRVNTLTAERDQLIQKNTALVAENAMLKEECGGNGSYRDCPACTYSQYIEAPETPVTDAAIAAIRADAGATAIEQFAVYMRSPGDDEFLDAIAEGVAKVADVFAAQLRQEGANHE